MGSYAEVQQEVHEDLLMQRRMALLGKYVPLNVPFLMAAQGTGKTRMAHAEARFFGLPVCTLNFGETGSSVEATGLPDLLHPGKFINPYDPDEDPENWQRVDDAHYTCWSLNEAMEQAIQFPTFLFIDDADKGPRALQSALLALTGERTVRDRKLHPETLVMLAGNRVRDDVLANEISESLLTRTTPVVLDYRYEDFERFSKESGIIHPEVLAFCSYKTEHVHNKPKDKTEDYRFPTPRGWEEVSHHIFYMDTLGLAREERTDRVQRMVSRKVGSATASDWKAWTDVLSKIDIELLLNEGRLVSTEMSDYASVAAAVLIAVEARKHGSNAVKEVPGLVKFFEEGSGIPKESKVVCFTMLDDVIRSVLAVSSNTINFTVLYAGLGLES